LSNTIGAFVPAGRYTTGYISNLRVDRTGLYATDAATIPVPTAPFEELAGTVFLQNDDTLTDQTGSQTLAAVGTAAGDALNPFIDVVTTNLVINLDAGNTASYSGTGSTWTNLVNNTQYSIINGTFDSGNGGSIVFDGTSTYVSIGTPLSGGTNFTKEAWVNADVVSFSRNILSSASNVFWNSGSILGGGVANSYSVVTSTNFPTLVWRHVVLTFDDTNDIMRLYINGVQVSEETEVTQSYISETERIGAHFFNGNPVSFWDGKIAQVRVYSAALTGAQVLQNFNSSRARYGQ
jgi:hypothetical protein